MFLKFCCRNVRETNFLTIIFIVVLSFESCISRDKRSCGEVFVQRSQNKSGFHRDLVTNVEWDILSSVGDHSNLLDCQLLLIEELPSGIFIDVDQIKNAVEFGGPEVLSTETINVELLAHHASSHKIFVFPKIAFDSRLGTINANITIPIHLRYHPAAEGTKFVSVSLSSPTIVGRCNGINSPAKQCGTTPFKAPCDATQLFSCDWIPLNSVSKDQSQSNMPLVLRVPVGQIEHTWLIIALTVLSTMAGCGLILWNSLAIT
ncbi:hypothetical protein OS493_033948 [Desmophyllum pertusum]|uniref:Phosphatidylinositol-glycan biosynthesis class X protein n=1 Tax=Desmophyllum pertusum TaxID=174260 RepID=A0A9W9ZIX6_9CNID|nr:hypothetical protein OS493_033948 [Desmophyllum pertusum]